MSKFIIDVITFVVACIPFFLLVLADTKSNLKKEIRYRQFFMPFVTVIYCLVIGIFMNKIANVLVKLLNMLGDKIAALGQKVPQIKTICDAIKSFIEKSTADTRFVFTVLVLFNTIAIAVYLLIKKIILAFFNNPKKEDAAVNRYSNKLSKIFYYYDEQTEAFYLKDEYIEGREFFKAAMWTTTILSTLALFVSYLLCKKTSLIKVPFYPVFAILIIGEIYFFVDGLTKEEQKGSFNVSLDDAKHVANYVILRKKLKDLFGKKLTAEGTTIESSTTSSSSIDEILQKIEKDYGFLGENYVKFINNQIKYGLIPDANYVTSGVELAAGKNLLFNTPFYYKLSPYVFYAMSSFLQRHGNVLIVMGRRGTTNDVRKWCEEGLFGVSHVPNLWKILDFDSKEDPEEDEEYYESSIGLISPEGVHDIEKHKKNIAFLKNVAFVVIIEPSRLVNTSQIGLNLLVENFKRGNKVVYCSVDRNCDGLVDSISHILQTNISEVSATEYPQGSSSYMCWRADNEYMQHTIVPGISRYLGFGTELSFAALKNQVKSTIWYGGDAFPVVDMHWISKQYYHDLLHYAELDETQENFDNYFSVSYNYCNEKTSKERFLTVEDEFYNLFEVKRDFSTIAKSQGFVNVLSSEYMLREYMTDNDCIFTADPKAIPYITADFARTDRNIILELCLRMCMDEGVGKEKLTTRLSTINADISMRKESGFQDNNLLIDAFWKFLCDSFVCHKEKVDTDDSPILKLGKDYSFEKKIIIWKNEYSREKGFSEDVFRIHKDYVVEFKKALLEDLQRAKFIAERDNEDTSLGFELKGHLFQRYLPGQKITIDGKLYQMETVTLNNKVLMRRAADHINGRNNYRQIRNYKFENITNSGVDIMGAYQDINGLKIKVQKADIIVDTTGYWELEQYNDFESGRKIELHDEGETYGKYKRAHYSKEFLCLDFSKFDGFTDDIRVKLTVVLNEIFRTLFADNQPYIVALTRGKFEKPLTYSLSSEGSKEKAIYIVEDSQLDIGLLVSVKRNIDRIFQMATDYLLWNHENVIYSWPQKPIESEDISNLENVAEEEVAANEEVATERKKGIFGKIGAGIKSFFSKIGAFFGKIFKRKKKKSDVPNEETESVEGGEDLEDNGVLENGEVPENSEEAEDVEVAEDSEETEDVEVSEDNEETEDGEAPEESEETEDNEETENVEVPEDSEETEDVEVPGDSEGGEIDG